MIIFILISAFNLYAYDSTDNKSQNKFDRIGIIEKYLQNLEKDLNLMAGDVENSKSEVKKIPELKTDLEKLKNEFKDLKQSITSGSGKSATGALASSDELKGALEYIAKLKEMKVEELKYKVEVQEFQIKSFLKEKQIDSETKTSPSLFSKPKLTP